MLVPDTSSIGQYIDVLVFVFWVDCGALFEEREDQEVWRGREGRRGEGGEERGGRGEGREGSGKAGKLTSETVRRHMTTIWCTQLTQEVRYSEEVCRWDSVQVYIVLVHLGEWGAQ